ncbi:MAG: nucleotidyltransferase family protein, partial [Clostridiales bacterium]|nr:nucleotidyltransferase family protein [Clostridiales bacterium]
IASILDTPNNILAVDYIRELERSGGNIKPFTVKRIGADHDSVSEDEGFASATYIRGLIKKGDYESAFTFMPESAKEIFIQEIGRGTAPVHIENLDTAVMSKLRTMTPDDYFILPDVSEGLENRLYKASRDSVTLEDCAMAAKTKRYTLSRLRRIYMCAYLGIKADDYERHVPYVRALGFNDTGRKLLTEIRENVPVIIKPAGILDKEFNEEIRAQFEREALFTDLYSLAYPALMKRLAGNEFRQSPTYLL